MLIANPEGVLMPMNTVQEGWREGEVYCNRGHRYDGLNYPSPAGACTFCVYQDAGMVMPQAGLPIADSDPVAVLAQRAARDSQPLSRQGVSPLYG
jgi:hypothetical protein